MDRFDALTAFLAVADNGSFVGAAKSLGQSAASITRQIAALEAHLGTSLFHRSTRSVVLSHEGAALVERARGILSDLRDAEQVLMGGGTEPKGEIYITAPVLYGRMHVLPVVCELIECYPELNIRMMLADRNVRLVEEGIDVALRIGDVPDSSLLSQTIGRVRRVIVASPDYLERKGVPACVSDLAGHHLIQNTSVSPAVDWQILKDEMRSVTFVPRLSVNSVDASIAAAEAGAGLIHVLDYQVKHSVDAGRLVCVLPDIPLPEHDVRLMYLKSRAAIPAVRVFLEAMKASRRQGHA